MSSIWFWAIWTWYSRCLIPSSTSSYTVYTCVQCRLHQKGSGLFSKSHLAFLQTLQETLCEHGGQRGLLIEAPNVQQSRIYYNRKLSRLNNPYSHHWKKWLPYIIVALPRDAQKTTKIMGHGIKAALNYCLFIQQNKGVGVRVPSFTISVSLR